jgi:hypothetical protein
MSRHRRPSPALVVACLALAVALGGTGYAAISLPANSVGTKQLKNNAVVAAKVKAHTLLRMHFKTGQIPRGERGATGLPGAAGAKGDKGDRGDKGDKGDPATRLFATVRRQASGGGVEVGPHSGFDTSVARPEVGLYILTTPSQSLTNCAVLAVPSGKDGSAFVNGQATAAITGERTVTVQTFNSSGTDEVNLDFFTVAAFC